MINSDINKTVSVFKIIKEHLNILTRKVFNQYLYIQVTHISTKFL